MGKLITVYIFCVELLNAHRKCNKNEIFKATYNKCFVFIICLGTRFIHTTIERNESAYTFRRDF